MAKQFKKVGAVAGNSKVSAILQLAEILGDSGNASTSNSDQTTELLTEILHYVKGIYDLLANRDAEETMLQSAKKSGIKRKASTPLTGAKYKKSITDIEESYHSSAVAEEEEFQEPRFEVVEYTEAENYELEEEDLERDQKPVIVTLEGGRKPPKRHFEFPMTEHEQLLALEEEIGKPSSQIRKKIIETVHTVQGNIKDHKVTIRTFLRVLFADELLVNYTWKGYDSKPALCSFKNLITFLKKIVIRWFPDEDLGDFVKTIQNYIKNVPQRLKKDH